MTKRWFWRGTEVSTTHLHEADPAADPEVQARVLRAARAWKVQTGRYATNLVSMAHEIEMGRTVLQVEEERT